MSALGKTAPKNPASFRDDHLDLFAKILDGLADQGYDIETIIDPFAGVGKIHELRQLEYQTYGVEIEPEWAHQSTWTVPGSVLDLRLVLMWYGWPFEFDVCITSPTFGNRMADHHEAKDDSKRNTYRHQLGRPLSEGSSAGLQWGERYRQFHQVAWAEVTKAVRSIFILNIKDHIRKGEVQSVTQWHIDCLKGLGWIEKDHYKIDAPGQRYGENGKTRVDYESVIVFEKGK